VGFIAAYTEADYRELMSSTDVFNIWYKGPALENSTAIYVKSSKNVYADANTLYVDDQQVFSYPTEDEENDIKIKFFCSLNFTDNFQSGGNFFIPIGGVPANDYKYSLQMTTVNYNQIGQIVTYPDVDVEYEVNNYSEPILADRSTFKLWSGQNVQGKLAANVWAKSVGPFVPSGLDSDINYTFSDSSCDASSALHGYKCFNCYPIGSTTFNFIDPSKNATIRMSSNELLSGYDGVIREAVVASSASDGFDIFNHETKRTDAKSNRAYGGANIPGDIDEDYRYTFDGHHVTMVERAGGGVFEATNAYRTDSSGDFKLIDSSHGANITLYSGGVTQNFNVPSGLGSYFSYPTYLTEKMDVGGQKHFKNGMTIAYDL
jgi:hypothetical protein